MKNIAHSKINRKRKTIKWICENFAQLDGKNKKDTLNFIISIASKQETEGNLREAKALRNFADQLEVNYGGKIQCA